MKDKQAQPSSQVHHQKQHSPIRQIQLGNWRDGGRVLDSMCRGAAVVDGNMAYFMNWDGQTYSYDSSTQKKWTSFPRCPHTGVSLAVIRGLLTAIGGEKGDVTSYPDYARRWRGYKAITDQLVSIKQDKHWIEYYPPMPTDRSDTAAVTTKQHLIVAGGGERDHLLDTVEIMNIETLVWSTAARLPHTYSNASAAICGDHLYMLGGCQDQDDHSKSVLTCSLTKLLQSCSGGSSDSVQVWHRTANVPVYHSTCVAVNGELVAVGGIIKNTIMMQYTK